MIKIIFSIFCVCAISFAEDDSVEVSNFVDSSADANPVYSISKKFTNYAVNLPQSFMLMATEKKHPEKVKTVKEFEERKNESVVLHFIALVEQYGYKAEEHEVKTEDGYILKMHRIRSSPKSPATEGKPVVYLQHGLYGSSDLFVILGPSQSLAMQLADAGYDVWLGNVRGNVYSRAHVELSPDDESNRTFWEFTMDDMGSIDLSTLIDGVLEKTGEKQVTYIGYSMGTTLSYILLSTKSKYNEKINLVISLAPTAYFSKPMDRYVLAVIQGLTNFAYIVGEYEIMPQSIALPRFITQFCSTEENNLCKPFISLFTDINNLNISSLPTLFSYCPAGTSYYAVDHFRQLIQYRKFGKYSYSCTPFTKPCKNIVKYGQKLAPEYDLSLITTPNIIFYANKDRFIKIKDAEKLSSKLQNVVAFEKVADDNFNHMDFVWSTKATELVYNRILEYLSEIVPK